MSSNDANASLNQVLSEVIDEITAMKQARRAVPESHALRTALDQFFTDLIAWKELLIERDEIQGVSPLAFMPSAAGRRPMNLWPHGADDDEVRRTIEEQIGRLEDHVRSAMIEQENEASRASLAQMQQGLLIDRQVLERSANSS
ncbi:MAG: hypothetical protein ABSF33_10400 [Acidimicrobiales bacterium]|jgi:hypothetical protein